MSPIDDVDLLDPSGCAVMVIDMQNDFCHPEGAIARMGQDTSAARDIVPAIRVLLSAARSQRVPVIFVQVTDSDWYDSDAWVARGAWGTVLPVDAVPLVREGSWGAELFGVEPEQGDLVITKHRYSAFAYTPLELALSTRRIKRLLLAGTQSDVCVQYTAADAVSRGFTPVVVEQCVATSSNDRQAAALNAFASHLGPVIGLADVTRAWSSEGPQRSTSDDQAKETSISMS